MLQLHYSLIHSRGQDNDIHGVDLTKNKQEKQYKLNFENVYLFSLILFFLQTNTNQINMRDYEKENCELLLPTIDFNHC
jgi:hypothetical protein